MIKTLYKFRFYSPSDQTFRTIWDEVPPTTYNGYNIDVNSVVVLDTISQNTIKIVSDPNDTNGNYTLEGIRIDIPSGQSNYTYTHINPVSIACFGFVMTATPSNLYDRVSVYIKYPEVNIFGDVNIGESNIYINPLIENFIHPGFEVSLVNGTTEETLGVIKTIDTSNHSIFTQYAASNMYSSSNTIMNTKSYYVKDITFTLQEKIKAGEGVIGGSYIPAGLPIYLDYHNNDISLPEKKLYCQIEYNY